MDFSLLELASAGDCSRPACSAKIVLGDCWVGKLACERECFCEGKLSSLGRENMTRVSKISVSPYRISQRHGAQGDRRRNRRWHSLLSVPAGSISGSKRRIEETSICHNIERPFCSGHSEGSLKKLRQLGHLIHHNSHVDYSSDSNTRKPWPNAVVKGCDNQKTSASKSCEGNSEYLDFRKMSLICPLWWVMSRKLISLLRKGGWTSLAFTNVRRPCAFENCCFRVSGQSVSAEASSVEAIRKTAMSTGWDSASNELGEDIVGLDSLPNAVKEQFLGSRWLWKRQQSAPSRAITGMGKPMKPTKTTWKSLPIDLQSNILHKVDFKNLFRFKTSSNSWKKLVESEEFRQSRSRRGISEGEFTAIIYYIKNKSWRCSGYDLHSKSWRSLPPMSYLPPPDPELFKEYSVCGHGGLMCAEVSKLPKKGELVVFNPLTGVTQALPPLLRPRNPVLVHISVDSATKSYKVIVAGSSAASDEHLSRKVEMFDSATSKWTEVCDLPGPAFGLNEHQAGVFLNGKLFLISFLESWGRGVVALDVENETWLHDLTTPIPWSSSSNTLQLVENDGKLFLFSEQESYQSVDHCIDELEFPNPKAKLSTRRWRSVVKAKKSGGRGLQVYPEHTCVSFGKGKLCIFNTLSRGGVVYDMQDGKKCENLEPPPASQMGDNFFSLNPASFTFQPNFAIKC